MNKALIVDDSRAVRGILGRILTRNGFTVCQAANGGEALKALAGEASDATLVCIDYHMPEMNGMEFLAQMRQTRAFLKLPVLMITSETTLDFIAKAISASVSEFVMKPFTEEMIVDKLRILGILPDSV
jgi:two-component system chemotaxis response regulator CheY